MLAALSSTHALNACLTSGQTCFASSFTAASCCRHVSMCNRCAQGHCRRGYKRMQERQRSLDHEVVYFVLSPDYNLYVDRQQAINVRLLDEFEKLGVGFAFPTHTVQLVGQAQ